MSERIDRESPMIKQNGAENESPKESTPTTQEKNHGSQDRTRDPVIGIEQSQLRNFRQVLNQIPTSLIMLSADDPADMRPPEAFSNRRVNVVLLIRVAMMIAM